MIALKEATSKLHEKGFLDLEIEDSVDLKKEIKRLKEEKNAVILAHYYQEAEIQEAADFVGDSLALAQQAAKTEASLIVFAGVHFMAETAKILNPTKKVLLPDLKAGCSLSDSCPPQEFKKFKEEHPNHTVVSYINTSLGIKALTDIVCTSSNAEKVIASIPEDQPILFAPDKNLGKWLRKKTGRDLLLWEGACLVHEAFSLDKILKLYHQYPEAEIIAHPESDETILEVASFIGSTSGLLNYVSESKSEQFIVATEVGILHKMKKNEPNKLFIPAPVEDDKCNCSECFYMKMNTLKKLYLCLKYELPEIIVDEALRQKALQPIHRMLAIS